MSMSKRPQGARSEPKVSGVRKRSFAARTFGALVGAAVLAAGLPATAFAEHREDARWRNEHREDRWDDRDHDRRHYGHDGGQGNHGQHRHGDWCRGDPAHGHGWGSWWRQPPRYARGVHYYQAPRGHAFVCRPCNRRFGSYDDLYGHVNHVHYVPAWRIPGLIGHASFGFVFGD